MFKKINPVLILCIVFVLLNGGNVGAGLVEGMVAYERGDYVTALKEFRALAEQGQPEAQYNIGLMYAFGRGVAQDYKEAIKWFGLAANQGYDKAQYSLGVMYHDGRGVPQDYILAHMWLSLARANGHKEAAKGIDLVEKQMTPTQIEEAGRLARERMAKKQK